MTLLDVIEVNAGFSTFRAIARGARGRVEDKLKERGPFTIFMPANFALSIYLGDTLVRDLKREDAESLIFDHVINGRLRRENMPQGVTNYTTLGSKELSVNKIDKFKADVMSNEGKASVKTFNIKTRNGVIHIIDSVP